MPKRTNTNISAVAIGGALGAIASWLIGMAGADVPVLVAGAITTLCTAAVAWVVPSSDA